MCIRCSSGTRRQQFSSCSPVVASIRFFKGIFRFFLPFDSPFSTLLSSASSFLNHFIYPFWFRLSPSIPHRIQTPKWGLCTLYFAISVICHATKYVLSGFRTIRHTVYGLLGLGLCTEDPIFPFTSTMRRCGRHEKSANRNRNDDGSDRRMKSIHTSNVKTVVQCVMCCIHIAARVSLLLCSPRACVGRNPCECCLRISMSFDLNELFGCCSVRAPCCCSRSSAFIHRFRYNFHFNSMCIQQHRDTHTVHSCAIQLIAYGKLWSFVVFVVVVILSRIQ